MAWARRVHPAALRDGHRVCGDDGKPFATVTGDPWIEDDGSISVLTDLLPVNYPAGTDALIYD